MKYNNIADYIRQNMEGFHGEFEITTTDYSEAGEGKLLALIHPIGRDGETADFILHPDGREEYVETVGLQEGEENYVSNTGKFKTAFYNPWK